MNQFMNNNGCFAPTYNTCCNVVGTCYVEEIPQYTNHHTHVINTCVRRYVNIPTFTTDEEMVYKDEYVNCMPSCACGYNPCMNQQMANTQMTNQFDMNQQMPNNTMNTQQPMSGIFDNQEPNINNPYMF